MLYGYTTAWLLIINYWTSIIYNVQHQIISRSFTASTDRQNHLWGKIKKRPCSGSSQLSRPITGLQQRVNNNGQSKFRTDWMAESMDGCSISLGLLLPIGKRGGRKDQRDTERRRPGTLRRRWPRARRKTVGCRDEDVQRAKAHHGHRNICPVDEHEIDGGIHSNLDPLALWASHSPSDIVPAYLNGILLPMAKADSTAPIKKVRIPVEKRVCPGKQPLCHLVQGGMRPYRSKQLPHRFQNHGFPMLTGHRSTMKSMSFNHDIPIFR